MTRKKIGRVFVAALGAGLLAAGSLAADAGPGSPLAAYAGFGHSPERDEERFTQEERQREELIAGCMKAKGFRYAPAPSILVTGAETTPPPLDDPNDAYVAGLTPPQRTAYYLALTGVADPYDEGLLQAGTEGGSSCLADAFEAVPGVFAARQALAEEVEELEQAVATDPRVAAAMDGWSACMAGKGFGFASLASMGASFDDAVARMLDAGDWDPVALLEVSTAQTEALHASEGCDDDLGRTLSDVRVELERAFVDEHRAVLDAHEAR